MAYTAVTKATLHFSPKIYTGTGSSLALTGLGFQPDIVWQKVRSTTSSHRITDVVRGTGEVLYPNDTAQQSSESAVTAFGTDGFTVGTEGGVNTNSATYASWSWKAGNSQGSSNTDGSINTTYTSVNTTAGISISQYTGTGSNATIGHGLGVAPELVLIKKTNSTTSWLHGQNGLGGWNYVLNLDSASWRANQSAQFQSTAPSSSVITIGTDGQVNASGDTYICYAFAPIKGFSRFGSFKGNGSTNQGPFVYTGFKPSFVMFKNITVNTTDYQLVDNLREGYNPDNDYLQPNSNGAEQSSDIIDLYSNGFRIMGDDSNGWNKDGETYCYAAFGQAVVGTNNIPTTAR